MRSGVLIRLATIVLACGLIAASPAMASPVNPIADLTSNGSAGDFAAVLVAHAPSYGTTYLLNTDNGQLFAGGFYADGSVHPVYGPLATFAPRSVSQIGGPNVNAFDFSHFDVPAGYELITYGGTPAALLSQSDTVVAGTVIVRNATNPGANYNPLYASGGNGGNGWGYVDGNTYGLAGSGGGGGMYSPGGAGDRGVPQIVNRDTGQVYWANGGAGGVPSDLNILAGGGGGGSGGHGCGPCIGLGVGGYGGGALFFGEPGDFTVTASGSIYADGQNGMLNFSDGGAGGGGGGAGGYLWFVTGGVWTNDGVVSARGGAGAHSVTTTYSNATGSWWGPDFYGGAGAGGYINIDPMAIYNNGLIDVSDGLGLNVNGGFVNLDAPIVGGTGEIAGSVAPEPTSLVLLSSGALGLFSLRRRRRASQPA